MNNMTGNRVKKQCFYDDCTTDASECPKCCNYMVKRFDLYKSNDKFSNLMHNFISNFADVKDIGFGK